MTKHNTQKKPQNILTKKLNPMLSWFLIIHSVLLSFPPQCSIPSTAAPHTPTNGNLCQFVPPFFFLILLSALMPSCPLVRLMRCAVIFGLKPPSESASFLNHHQLFQRMVTLTPHPPVAQESQMLLGNYSQHGGRTGNTSSLQSLADPTPFKGILKAWKIIINCCFFKQPGFSHHLSQFIAVFFAHVLPKLPVYFALSKQIHL